MKTKKRKPSLADAILVLAAEMRRERMAILQLAAAIEGLSEQPQISGEPVDLIHLELPEHKQ